VTDTSIIDASDPSRQKKVVQKAVDLLKAGEVVALPTETVYGLGADALNPDAVTKVFEAKARPAFDPLIVHVGSYEQVSEIADIPEELEEVVAKLMKAFWPGPMTMVLPKKSCIPDIVTSVFVTTPNKQVLIERLKNRGTETKDSIEVRLINAMHEMKRIDEYDFLLINDEFEEAKEFLRAVAISSLIKKSKYDISKFIDSWKGSK